MKKPWHNGTGYLIHVSIRAVDSNGNKSKPLAMTWLLMIGEHVVSRFVESNKMEVL
jgi:hypothetical protein